jgi:transporter family-2 protein
MDFLWAMLGGSVIPIQAGINAQLRNILGHPVLSVLVSVSVSVLSLLVYIVTARLPLTGFGAWQQAPWWTWLGGVCGALFLIAMTTLAPRLGSIALIACVIAGQVLCSVILDQYGLLGFKQHSLNIGRLAGVACLGVGVYLVLRY